MSATIYFVSAYSGYHDNYATWIVAAYTTKKAADEHRSKAQRRSDEIQGFRNCEHRRKAVSRWDRNSEDMQQGAHYVVQPLLVLEFPGEYSASTSAEVDNG